MAALLHIPEEEPRGTVLMAHAFGSSKDLRGTRRIAERLAGHGWASLRFDFTGLGGSDGWFEETTFQSNIKDLQAVASWLSEQGRPPSVLLGHSLGGAASVFAAPQIPSARVVATLATPSSTHHLRDAVLSRAPNLMEDGTADIEVAGNKVSVGKGLVTELEAADLPAAVASLRLAFVVFHSVRDEIVNLEHAGKLFSFAKHPKSFVSLDQADHLLLSDERDAHLVADTIVAFGERYYGS